MSIDDLWAENIDELVNDENKVLTFKSLSYHLKVHCNVAKQMLYTFLTQERDKKGRDSLSATYFISGLTKPDEDGIQVFKCLVTKEETLAEKKKLFAVITSCHVYSIQKSKLRDTNPLYMSDYEKLKENIFDCNRYSSIHYDKAKPRSDDDMDLLMVNIPVNEPEKKPTSASNSGSSKPVTKKGPQSAIANMFAKVDNSRKGANKTETVKQEAEKVDTSKGTTKGSKKGAGGMMGFLSKQNESKQAKTTSEEKKKTPEKKESPIPTKKEPSPAVSKKSQRKEDSDDEDIFRSKKRRRTKQDIFESSSEEEEMEEEQECPVPAKEPSPEPEIIEDEEEPVPQKPSEPSPAKESEETNASTKHGGTGEKKRRRKRKLVPKTYLDKDGFMVTEKVWESDSTDASEVEEPVKKPTPKPPTPDKGKKGSPKKKVSPGKKGQQGSGKQTSLMSFFKKS